MPPIRPSSSSTRATTSPTALGLSTPIPARRPGIRAVAIANSRVAQPDRVGDANVAVSSSGQVPSNGQGMPTHYLRARKFRQLIHSSHNTMLARHDLANKAGLTYDGNRKLDDALGRLNKITPSNYHHRYTRGGLAGIVVDKMVTTALRSGATILSGDSDGNNSTPKWDDELASLFTRLRVWDVLRQSFIQSRIGKYSIIVIGTDMASGETLSRPLTTVRGVNVNYLRPFEQVSIRDPTINEIDKDESSPLFGYPLVYNVAVASVGKTHHRRTTKVHRSRVIHIADSLTPYGKPILQRPWNDLDDLDKIVGAGAEGSFQNAHKRAWSIDPDVEFDSDETGSDGDVHHSSLAQTYEDALGAFNHGVINDVLLQGLQPLDIKTIIPQYGDNAKLSIQLVAAATGYPYRVILGTEEGKLAGEQDSAAFADDVRAYRLGFCERHVRLLVDWFMTMGVLGDVEYNVNWASAEKLSPLDRSVITEKLARANRQQFQADSTVIVEADQIREIILGDDFKGGV